MGGRPRLFRIPFSHYCQKAEWGLTHAGISYDCVDIPLRKMTRLPKTTKTGLVPTMIVDGKMLEGSDTILRWAALHADPDAGPLYPKQIRRSVVDWEEWAGDIVGPVARREAYRVAYDKPLSFTNHLAVRMIATFARPLVLGVLKHYKARRYENHDNKAVPKIVSKIANKIGKTGSGYLLTSHATAADFAVAALCRPLTYAAGARNYGELSGWEDVVSFIERVKPNKTTRRKKRQIRERDWEELAKLAAA